MGRIMIVGPSLLDRKRMATVLEAAGHRVVEVSSPAQVWDGPWGNSDEPVDLIVTDLDAGNEEVLSFLLSLKQNPRWCGVPAVVVTPPVPRTAVIELAKAGAEVVVTKPFAPEVLLRRVTEVLVAFGDGVPEDATRWDLTAELARELKRSERLSTPVAVAVLRLAHKVDLESRGDLLDWMGRALRASDRVSQIGPEEVALLLPDADAAGADEAARRLVTLKRKDGSAGFKVLGVGVAAYPRDAGDAAGLIRLAQERAADAYGRY